MLARQAVGEDIEAPRRQLAALAGSITSLKSQIDTLPDGVRTRFVPAIRAAEAEFIRLSAAPAALPGEIEAARQRLVHLTQDSQRAAQAMAFSQGFGGAGATGVNLGLDQRALQGYNAQLQILQSAIGRASAEARGPAVAAFERLRNAVATAFDEGNIDSRAQRDNLAALRTQAIAAAAAASQIRVGSLTRDVSRAGDIGRAGFDKFALAANQAGYAIDDFLSSTGGLEFKLRAISNNITQLAFILGGTTGLFIGLGAVIAGQAAVGILKWINNGRTAEDQTKALNDALARQKSVVEELAQAFKSLGDEIARGTLSEGGQQARAFATQVEEIRKKQRESREGRVADLDPNIQRERAQQIADRNKLEKETDPGQRIVLARQIQRSEERERGSLERLRSQPAPSGLEVSQTIGRAASRLEEAGRSQRPGDERFPVAEKVRAAGAGLNQGSSPEAIRAQIKSLNDATRELEATSKQTFLGLFQSEEAAIANVAIRTFAELSERLSASLVKAIDDAAIQIAEASRGPAEQIRQAQEEVAKAIDAGLPGARVFGAELDKIGSSLSEAYKKLNEAVSGKDATGKDLTVDEKEARTKQAQAEIDALNARRRDIAAQADAFAYERIVDPQRQIDARISRAQSNLGSAGLEDGRIARRIREIEAEREQIRRRAELPEFQTPEMRRGLQDAEEALNEEAAAIEAATIAIKIFAAELNKAAEEVSGNLNSAQQRADEARRADLGNSTPRTLEARRQAEADLEAQRGVERQAQTEVAVQRDRLEQAAASPEAARIQQIDEELKSGAAGNAREELIRERETLTNQMEDDARRSQRRVDAARDASTAEDEFQKSAARGRELGMTERDKDKEKAAGIGADIAARASQIGNGREREQFINDATRNAMREAAPALVAMDEQFKNAMREPSRARIEATDINSQQGQSELTRLLRGDDEAKNQNLEALNKQIAKLEEIKQAVIANTGQVVN
jgi:hypothetical protein